MDSPNLQSAQPSILKFLPWLFFLSGVSSLIFETIFTRLLTYTFGNTAQAVSTVLAAFLGGLALGACVIGRWVDRRKPSLWIYGTLELMVGGYCLFVPKLFEGLTRVYVTLCHQFQLGASGVTALRFALGGTVILVPTVLMGGTLPALARFIAAARSDFAGDIDRLYGWNTFGAAAGTLVSTFLLMPELGLTGTIWTACSMNLAIFVTAALWLRPSYGGSVADKVETGPAAHLPPTELPDVARTALLVGASLTGAVALAYEVIWTHVLAFTVGNTVYAFGVMLFTLLCGLGSGAAIVCRYLADSRRWAPALAVSQLGLSAAILLTLPLWSHVPDVFAGGLIRAFWLGLFSLAFVVVIRMAYLAWTLRRHWAVGRIAWGRIIELGLDGLVLTVLLRGNPEALWRQETTFFVVAELLRFLCAFGLLLIPAVLVGVSFPVLLNLYACSRDGVGKNVGGIYAANTVGAIAGSLATGFFILPLFGSLATFRLAATINLALGACFALLLLRLTPRYRLGLAVVSASLALLLWAGQGGWDARRMTRGSYVYFNRGWPIDRVLYLNEDTQGGLTSVVQLGRRRVLLSNGKFQGDNTDEVQAQIRFALTPILFTRNLDRALVIGLGTGNTLRAVASFPFRRIDTVELAPQIVDAARKWFTDVNGDVFDRDPRVHLSIADGRNYLLLSRDTYNLITIEVTSIWISGEADLYNREFYKLCRQHLGTSGVLQQWVQIHHMRPQDFLVVLNTAAQVFPHVAFFQGPEQGLIIASAAPLECDYQRLRAFDLDPKVRRELEIVGVPSMTSLLGEMLLYEDSVWQAVSLLPGISGLRADSVSTDFRPYLEYQTPKGNAVPYDTVPVILNMLRSVNSRRVMLPVVNLPSENEANLVRGYVAEARGDVAVALEFFGRVDGPEQARAKTEMARIQSATKSRTP